MYLDECKRHQTLLPNDIYFTNWKDFTMDFHVHDIGSLEVNYVTRGSCQYIINGNVVDIKAKNLLLINASHPHKLVFTKDNPCPVAGISIRHSRVVPGQVPVESMVEAYGSLRRMLEGLDDYILIKNGKAVYPYIKSIVNEIKEYGDKAYEVGGFGHKAYASLLVTRLLVAISRIAESDNENSYDYVNKVKSYIYNSYYEIESVDEIANRLNLNKTYLQKIFKEETGLTIWKFLNDVRMSYAAGLLKNTDFTIETIYEAVGFHSRQSFNNAFVKKYQATPSEYRDMPRMKDME